MNVSLSSISSLEFMRAQGSLLRMLKVAPAPTNVRSQRDQIFSAYELPNLSRDGAMQ